MSGGNLENRGNLKSISWEYELAIDCILILNSKALNLSCQRKRVSGEDIKADHILFPFQKSMQGIPALEKAG